MRGYCNAQGVRRKFLCATVAAIAVRLPHHHSFTARHPHPTISTMTEVEQQKPTEEVKIEEIKDEKDDHSDDEPPGLESTEEPADKAAKQSRTEKKSRKAIQKLGMKPVSGIVRVTVKKNKGVWIINCFYFIFKFILHFFPHILNFFACKASIIFCVFTSI